MKVKPIYAENIIVFIIHNGNGQWFVSDKEFWYLDLRKLIKAFEEIGYQIPNPDDFSHRFNIDIVNRDSTEKFLEEMKEYQVGCEELTNLLRENSPSKVRGLSPSLFINFDLDTIYSYFPEPASFEKHIPDGWMGHYQDITKIIPDEYKYWILGNKDLLRKDI